MSKKLIMSCMALVAFAAFVLPATASAANKPTATDAAGVVKVGAGITGTSIGETTFLKTDGVTGLVHCTTAHLSGTVTRNDSGFVEGTISSAKFSGTGAVSADNGLNECTGSFGNAFITVELPMCLKSTPTNAEDEFEVGTEVTGKTCAEAISPANFIIGSTTAGECTYRSTSTVKGHFTTGGTQSVLTVTNTQTGSGSSLVKGGFLCPTSGQLKMEFKIETTANNEPIFTDKLP